MNSARHEFEPLREDPEVVLYRRHGAADEADVLVVTAASESVEPLVSPRLKHELDLLGSTEIPPVLKPLSLAEFDGRLGLLLEDPGGRPLASAIGRPFEISNFLSLAIGIAGALDRVHAAGIIHRDLRPGNIFVTPSGQVRVTGFGLASRLVRETLSADKFEMSMATLPYMAPEQSGRLNRSTDRRSDLYSMGAIFYEMLVGAPPFAATTAKEWVHSHVARLPAPPGIRVENIPPIIDELVLKLLAKNAEDRYQTAAGVEYDLKRYLDNLLRGVPASGFTLAEEDMPDRLALPEKLYGREGDLRALVEAFDNVSAHPSFDFALVSGDPGIGKSTLVGELRRAVYAVGGLCASGKFDQFERDIPYATLSQAFGTLLRQLLRLDDVSLSQWRADLLNALGASGRIITEVFPELELIVGRQPDVPDVPPQEARNRFHHIFARFLSVFATSTHPLVLFLDDLQWADGATLELIKRLACDEQLPHLLVLGAYRRNEVGPGHDLRKVIDEVTRVRGGVLDIELQPLKPSELASLVESSLRRSAIEAEPLIDLIFTRTSGNPFFAAQFLTSLSTEGLLWFDPTSRKWEWDLDAVRRRAMTTGVASLLAARLARYDAFTRYLSSQLAALGDRASLDLIKSLVEAPEENIRSALELLVADGLLTRSDECFTFVHDHVREAAYSLIDEDQRPEIHLAIARLLKDWLSRDSESTNVFAVVDHFSRAASHIISSEERVVVAELNLSAARRAKAGAAYDAARTYLTSGLTILDGMRDVSAKRIQFELESDLSDCEFMLGDVEAAEQRLTRLAAKDLTDSDLVSIVRRQLSLHMFLGDFERAVRLSVDCLAKLGSPIPPRPSLRQLETAYDELLTMIAGEVPTDLTSIPRMTEKKDLLVSRALCDLFVPAAPINTNLVFLAAIRLAKLSLRSGLSQETPVALACLAGQISGWKLGTFEQGKMFGEVALSLVQDSGLDQYASRVYAVLAGAGGPWNMPLAECHRIAVRATEIGREQGGTTYSGYAWGCALTASLDGGRALAEVERQAESSLAITEALKFPLVVDFLTAQLMLVRALRDPLGDLRSLSNETFDEAKYEARLHSAPHLWHALVRYRIRKLQLYVIADNIADALDLLPWLDREAPKLQVFELAEFHLYSAIARARGLKEGTFSTPGEAQAHKRRLLRSNRKLQAWTRLCPENFASRSEMVAAEVANLRGKFLEAEARFEKAIAEAHEQGFLHLEALTYELASRSFDARHMRTAGNAYLEKARSIYADWGAQAKVTQIDQENRSAAPTGAKPSDQFRQLDVSAAVDTYQALSREIVLDTLIERLMVTVIENAGASRGLLLLSRDDRLRIVAEAKTSDEGVSVVSRRPAHYSGELPESVLNYVTRTHEVIIVDDALTANAHSGDSYLRRVRPRSLLCLPLVKQARLVGVLYLENNFAAGSFTAERVTSLELIAAQAAISIENAELFMAVQKKQDEVRQASDEVRRSFDMIPALAWSASADGRLEFSNKQWNDFTGIAPDDARGLTWMQCFHPDDAEKVAGKWQQLVRYRSSGEFEARMRRSDGIFRRFLVRLTPMCDANGDVLRWHGTNTDIDDLKQAEEAQEALARVSRVTAMGALSVSIAHEINQPLMAIVTNAATCLRWLSGDVPDIAEAKLAAERIVRDGHRAGDVVASIRAMARNSGREGVNLRVSDLVDEVLQLTRNELERNAIAVETDIEDGATHVFGDRTQIQQVLLNLVLNGIEAIAESGRSDRSLRIATNRGEPGFANVTVADTGIGLSGTSTERIFDPFYTTKADGVGIGLSICRSIIESHGGRIWASTSHPVGSAFHFALPIREGAQV